MAEPDLSKFLKFVGPLTTRAGGIQVSALLVESPDGWRVMSGRVTTLAVPGKPGIRRLKRAGRLLGISMVAGRSMVKPVLHALQELRMLFPGAKETGAARLVLAENAQPQWSDLRCIDRESARMHYDLDWPVHVAIHYGAEISKTLSYEELSTLGSSLASTPPAYEDLNDLCSDLGVARYERLETSSSSILQLVVPVWVKLHGAETDPVSGRFTVTLDAEGSLTRDSVVAVMPARAEPLERAVVPASKFRPLKGSPGLRIKRFPLPTRDGAVAIALSHGLRTVDQIQAGLPGLRATAHGAVDADMGKLRIRLLEPTKAGKGAKPQDHLEHGVAWLLHLMGFSAVAYGPLGECPDIISFGADGKLVLVVECSVEVADPQKLKKLRIRRARVQDLLDDRGIEARVVPLLATCMDAALLDIEQAEAQGIVLLGGGALSSLLDALRNGRPHSHFCARLKKLAEDCDPEDPMRMSAKLAERMFRGQ